MAETQTWEGFTSPGKGAGLLDVFHKRYLLKLLVRKELQVRYRGSVLGLLWSYVKPAVQFAVFYYALGEFLALKGMLTPFAVYLFSGVIVMNLFTEAFGNATRSVVDNASLVKKVYLPRELFPVSSYFVSLVHFTPQLVILLIGAISVGWTPSLGQIGAFIIGFVIVSTLSIGLGLLCGAINVVMRDIQNIVEVILMVIAWLVPVLYSWTRVRDALGDGWALFIYQANPLSISVELFHLAFWYGASDKAANEYEVPPHIWEYSAIGFITALAFLIVGQVVFRRLEGRFAQEL